MSSSYIYGIRVIKE